MDKTVTKVELTFSDGTRRSLSGEDARRWQEANNSVGFLAANHGCPFPAFEWTEEKAE